jgi:hypothetical protein
MRGRRNDIGSLDTARRPGAMAIQRKFVAMANIHPLAQALEDKVVNPVHRQFRL